MRYGNSSISIICADCYRPLSSSSDTDGNGGLVELVAPCAHCRIVILRRTERQPAEPAEAQPSAHHMDF
jgi:hypothetical protein